MHYFKTDHRFFTLLQDLISLNNYRQSSPHEVKSQEKTEICCFDSMFYRSYAFLIYFHALLASSILINPIDTDIK
jgi:hypothetical protein